MHLDCEGLVLSSNDDESPCFISVLAFDRHVHDFLRHFKVFYLVFVYAKKITKTIMRDVQLKFVSENFIISGQF